MDWSLGAIVQRLNELNEVFCDAMLSDKVSQYFVPDFVNFFFKLTCYEQVVTSCIIIHALSV